MSERIVVDFRIGILREVTLTSTDASIRNVLYCGRADQSLMIMSVTMSSQLTRLKMNSTVAIFTLMALDRTLTSILDKVASNLEFVPCQYRPALYYIYNG